MHAEDFSVVEGNERAMFQCETSHAWQLQLSCTVNQIFECGVNSGCELFPQ